MTPDEGRSGDPDDRGVSVAHGPFTSTYSSRVTHASVGGEGHGIPLLPWHPRWLRTEERDSRSRTGPGEREETGVTGMTPSRPSCTSLGSTTPG